MGPEEVWIFSKLWQFLNIVYLPMLFTYFNHVFTTLLDFLVLAHYIRFFGSFCRGIAILVNCFLRQVQFLLYQSFFSFLLTLFLFLILRVLSPPFDMISVGCLTAFWITLVLLDESYSNLSFPNFSGACFWFSKEWNETAPWLSHLYVFGWLSTSPFPNLTKELLEVAVIGAC